MGLFVVKESLSIFIGIICIIFCIINWVFSSLYIQYNINSSYNKPFFLRYFVNSSYIIIIIPWYIIKIYNNNIIKSKILYDNNGFDVKARSTIYSNNDIESPPSTDDISFSNTDIITFNGNIQIKTNNSIKAMTNNTNYTAYNYDTKRDTMLTKKYSSINTDDGNDDFSSTTIHTNKPIINNNGIINSYGLNHFINGELVTDTLLVKKLFKPMIIFSTLGTLSGAGYYWSLKYLSTATANTIYQSECVYVYILSIGFLGHKLEAHKIMAIIVSMIGVGLISYTSTQYTNKDDGSESDKSVVDIVYGLILVISSTIMFSIVEVGVNYYGDKYFRKNRKIQDTLLFQILLGLNTLLFTWIFFIIFAYLDIESFELPSNMEDITFIIFTASMDLLYQLSYFIGITLLNVFIMTMSSLLVIPISYIAVLLIFQDNFSIFSIVGSILVFIGFFLLEASLKKLKHICECNKNTNDNDETVPIKSQSQVHYQRLSYDDGSQ